MLNILSLGAGVQSTTLALMAARGEVTPMPDCAIFADTQGEPMAVYKHLEWLCSPGVLPYPVHVVSRGNLWESATRVRRTRDGLRTYISTGIPAYTMDGETRGIGRRQCTRTFKIEPIVTEARRLLGRKQIRQTDGTLVSMWMGISLDEAIRRKPARQSWIEGRWPLLELGVTRQDCLDWMKRNGYPTPPKSSCTFCPYHDNEQWRALAADEFSDAVVKEKELQRAYAAASALRSTPYLHASRKPLGEIDFTSRSGQEPDLFNNEC